MEEIKSSLNKFENSSNNKLLKILLITIISYFYLPYNYAHADIVFPAIVQQFAVSMVIPSYYSIILGLFVLIVESYFLNKLFSKNWFICFILAFIINLISSIVGIFLFSKFEFATREIMGGFFGYKNMRWGTYVGMLPGYFLTVLTELIILISLTIIWFRKNSNLKLLIKLSITMNFYSYLILLFGIIIADILTKGQNFNTF